MTCPVLVYSAAIAGVALNGMYLLNVYLIFKVLEVFALTNQLGKFFRFERNKFGFFQKFFLAAFQIQKAHITWQGCNRGRNKKKPADEKSAGLNHMNLSYANGICLQSQNFKRIFGVSSE